MDATALRAAGPEIPGLSVGAVRARAARACADAAATNGRSLVEMMGAFEDVKNALDAAQDQMALELRGLREAHAQALDLGDRGQADARRSAASEVALARRESPRRASLQIGLARVLTAEMPHTWDAYRTGRITQWRATLMARETACLALGDRRVVDAEMSGLVERLSDRELEAEAKRRAYRLDPGGVVRAADRLEDQRSVTSRPVSPTMVRLSALVPMTQGVAAHASLLRAAEGARAQGDPRGRNQIMADTLIERLTGQAAADAVPLEVQVVITDHALLAGTDTPAEVPGFGPIPAAIARRMITRGAEFDRAPSRANPTGQVVDLGSLMTVRRLYAAPESGELIAMDSRSRLFPDGLRDYVATRDNHTCRTPYCSAPVRQIDHVTPYSRGGPTSADNAQGLCQHCNLAKQAPGWHAHAAPDGTIALITPTGRQYVTGRPALPHERPRGGARTRARPRGQPAA